jgi:hypothetical protein
MSEGLVIPLSNVREWRLELILIIARTHHRLISSASGTLIKQFVIWSSGVKVRNVDATDEKDEQPSSQRGQFINTVAVGAFRLSIW